MSYQQQDTTSWQILVDRFIWSDEHALASIPEAVSDEEVQKYLYAYHGDKMTIDEIKKWRKEREREQ